MFCFLTFSAYRNVSQEHWLNRCVPENQSCTLACDTAACLPTSYTVYILDTCASGGIHSFIHSFIYSPLYVGVTSLSVKCIQYRTITSGSNCTVVWSGSSYIWYSLTSLSLFHVSLSLSMPWRRIGGVVVKDPLLLNPYARWMWVVNIMPHFLYPQERTMALCL
jgi:hypothetical protein